MMMIINIIQPLPSPFLPEGKSSLLSASSNAMNSRKSIINTCFTYPDLLPFSQSVSMCVSGYQDHSMTFQSGAAEPPS